MKALWWLLVVDVHGRRVDVRLERLVGVAERRQGERLGLGEGGAAEHGRRARKRCGSAEQLQGISAIHGVLRSVSSRGRGLRERATLHPRGRPRSGRTAAG